MSSQNYVFVFNVSKYMQSKVKSSQQQLPTISERNEQVIVLAVGLFEIRDNLAEAREALDKGNFLELSQHIDNIDHLVTVMVNPLPEDTSDIEKQSHLTTTINNIWNGQDLQMGHRSN